MFPENPTAMKKNPQILIIKKLMVAAGVSSAIAWAGPIPKPTHIAQSVGTERDMHRGNFENRSISSHRYLSSWQGWKFGPNTGIVREKRDFAAKHNFGSGSHSLFLQKGDSSAERSVGLSAGAWQFSFHGAQRIRRGRAENQLVQVSIDGRVVYEDYLSDDGIKRYYTRTFQHDGNRINVLLKGLNGSGDNSAVLDNFRFHPVGLWNDTATWEDGKVPTSVGNNVRIPSGVRVALDEDSSLRCGHLHIQGELGVISQGGGKTELSCSSALVDGSRGSFVVGTDRVPHPGLFDLRLSGGNRTFDVVGFGNKFLGARNGGLISLHGGEVESHLELEETASKGAKEVIVQGTTSGWSVGDDIIICPTGRKFSGKAPVGWRQIERREITKISSAGSNQTRIQFNKGLSHEHLGRSFTTEDKVAPRKTWRYEVRGRVGNLKRRIRIVGDNPGSKGFGGHIMIMGKINGNERAGIARIKNVHLKDMGQKSIVGRYPMHWHMLASDGEGQYLDNCSIENSFNRAVTVHGTHGTTVANNFAYRHLGHGIFLEDGGEEDNSFVNNLVVDTKKPKNGEEILSSDNAPNSSINAFPSAFWIANPKNTFDDNIVSGTEGVGYWFILNDSPTGLSASDKRLRNLTPRTNPLGSFKSNVVNSARMGFDLNDAVNPRTLDVDTNVAWNPDSPQILEGTKIFANQTGIYSGLFSQEDEIFFQDTELLDNQTATRFATNNTVIDSLVVAKVGSGLGSGDRTAILLYDGPGKFLNTHFHGFNAAGTTLARMGGGSGGRSNWFLEGTSFNHSNPPRIKFATSKAAHQADVLVDVDGTITGTPQTSITTSHPILRSKNDIKPPRIWRNAYISRREFATLLLKLPKKKRKNQPVDYVRVTGKERVKMRSSHSKINNSPLIAIINDDEVTYDVEFPDGRPSGSKITLSVRDCGKGDTIMFRFRNLGTKARIKRQNRVNSVSAVRNARKTSYHRKGNDLYLKYVRTIDGGTEKFDIHW